MSQQGSTQPGGQSNQTGSVLIVAMVSILSVGAIAAGTNAVLTQDAVTANEKTLALQGMSVADSLRLQSNPAFMSVHTDLRNNLYTKLDSFSVNVFEDVNDPSYYNGIVQVGEKKYGYSIQPGIQTVTTRSDLKNAAPNIGTLCQLPSGPNLGNSIDLKCNLKNTNLSIEKPWRIKNLDMNIKIHFKLKNSDLSFENDFEVYGEQVEVYYKDSKNSSIEFNGAFATVADKSNAYVEFKSLKNGEVAFNGGFVVSGTKAEFRVQDLLNTDLSIAGPLVVDGRDDEAKVEIKKLQNRMLDVSGPVYVTGEKSKLIINEQKNTSINFSDRVIVDGGSESAYAEVKAIQNEGIVFDGGLTVQGKKTEIKIENFKNSELSFGNAVKLTSTSQPRDEVLFSIKSVTNKEVSFDESILLDGSKTKFTLQDFDNASALLDASVHMFSNVDESVFQVLGLKNKSVITEGDFFIHGSPSEFKFDNLKNSEVRFDQQVYVAPTQLGTEAKGNNGVFSVDGLSQNTDYVSPKTCSDPFGSVICTTEANNRAAIDGAHAQVPTPSVSEIKDRIDYTAGSGGGGGAITRRAVQ